jgi:hypothetical protein
VPRQKTEKDPFSGQRFHGLFIVGLYVGLFVLLACLTLVVTPVQVQAQTTGLAKGQWASYSISGDLSEGVYSSKFTVEGVTSISVIYDRLDAYLDSPSQLEPNLLLDLSTGQGTGPTGFYFAIYPGKIPPAPVYQDPQFNISGIRPGTFAQASRPVNYAIAFNGTDRIAYYWDLQTGIFTEVLHTAFPGNRTLVHAAMTATNIWNPTIQNSSGQVSPEIGYYSVGALMVGLLAIAAVRGKRRKRRNRS